MNQKIRYNDMLFHTEMIKIYWEEYKFRHKHYWETFYKLSIANIFLVAAPYFHKDEIGKIFGYEIIIPLLSVLFTTISVWLLSSEYARIQRTQLKLNDLRGEPYITLKIDKGQFNKIFHLNMGRAFFSFCNSFLVIGRNATI